jgi:hypothetical protein
VRRTFEKLDYPDLDVYYAVFSPENGRFVRIVLSLLVDFLRGSKVGRFSAKRAFDLVSGDLL